MSNATDASTTQNQSPAGPGTAVPVGTDELVRVLPSQSERVETGPTRFGDDWTGVFIRGDNAFYYAQMLKGARSVYKEDSAQDFCVQRALAELIELLESSNEAKHPNK